MRFFLFSSTISVALIIIACTAQKNDQGSDPKRQLTANIGGGDPAQIVKLKLEKAFGLSPEQITQTCDAEKVTFQKAIDKVAAVPPNQATFENSVRALERAIAKFMDTMEPVNFMKYVSTNAEARQAADACETQVSKLFVDIFARKDLFGVLKAFEAKGEPLSPVDAKLLKEFLDDFRRNGLELPEDKQKLYLAKKKQLVELQTEFEKNLVEWKDHLVVTKEELEGLPEDYINGLEKTSDGKYKVNMTYPQYFPFMQNAKNATARKNLQHKFLNRGGKRNTELLEQAVQIRHELANLLGMKTHAQFVLKKRMANNPDAVLTFLERLKTKLIPKGRDNLEELLALKKDELGPSATKIDFWDWRYYENQLKKKKFQVDHQKIKEYFPLDVVNKGMFEIYETLLNVDFVEANDMPVWHETVLPFKVQSRETGKTIAFFYMDLFPREGKYGHAAAFTLMQGHELNDGNYQIPVSSIVANFNPPSANGPSLLLHSQVETHFHEFGHIMHQVLTRAKYASFSGTSVMRDFVEAPSQMLENWVWTKESLGKLSGHYSDPSKKLPDDLLDKLLKAKLVNVGIRYLRQLFFATLDMTYHTQAKVDSTEIYRKLIEQIMLIPLPESTQPQASFGHLMGGYDAGYYGYLWSEVYAQDMFTRFEKEGLLSPTPGADYRKWILEPGGTIDPIELITKFIGREPNEEAFYKSLGL